MRSNYPSVLPVEITERIKNIDNIYKIANIKLTPVNKSYPLVSSESPRVEIYLPSDSVLNFANAILEADITFNHRGNAAAGSADNYVQTVYPPRYGLASLIEEYNVYINGVQASTTKRYNYIHNWVRDWLNSYDVEINDGLNDCRDPSLVYSKPTAGGMSGRIVPRRGFPASVYNDNAAMNDINIRLKNKYHFNLGDGCGFFGEASSKILNTAILGEIKLEFVFTSQIASCILGSAVPSAEVILANTDVKLGSAFDTAQTKGADSAGTSAAVNFARQNVENQTGRLFLGDTGIPTLGNANATRDGVTSAGAIVADTANVYNIRDVVLHVEALQFKTSDYYDIMNRLVDSGLYKYHFKRYVLQTDAATTSRQIDYRLVVNSECLNYVLATFRPAGYDTLANPVNTLIAPTSTGHCGVAECTHKYQVDKGMPFTFNQSKFFLRNGQKIARLGWKVDEVYFEPRNKREMYIDNLRHWRNYVPGIETKPHDGLKNLYDFENCYYTGILSFENKSEDEVKYIYSLRGLNTNGKAVAISCFTETEVNNFDGQAAALNQDGFSDINLNPAGAAIPTFLVCTTAALHLQGRRNIDIRY